MIDTSTREQGFGTGLLAHLERGRDPLVVPPEPLPHAEPVAELPEPEPDLRVERERLLAERERLLDEREAALAAALAAREERPPETAPAAAPLPQYVRARAEREAERVWSAFSDGLAATDVEGRPDHAVRIAAAQALLAELRLDPPGAAFADELARRRDLREAGL